MRFCIVHPILGYQVVRQIVTRFRLASKWYDKEDHIMSVLTVALLQLADGCDDQAKNLARGEAFCRRARTMGADIALFPEMWNITYTFDRHAEAGAPEQGRSSA